MPIIFGMELPDCIYAGYIEIVGVKLESRLEIFANRTAQPIRSGLEEPGVSHMQDQLHI